MDDVNFEHATILDAQSICRLFDEVGDFHNAALPHIFTNGSNREIKEIEDIILNANNIAFVAKQSSQVIGIAVGMIKESYAHPSFVNRKYGWIDSMAVAVEYRNKGIGRALLTNLHDWFLSNEITKIELNVYEFNINAIRLYEKMGYSPLKRVMSVDLLSMGDHTSPNNAFSKPLHRARRAL